MRNHNHSGATLPPVPFDELAGLEIIEPRNKMELDSAWCEYQLALYRFKETDHDHRAN